MSKDDEQGGVVPGLRFPEFRGDDRWMPSSLSELCEVNPLSGDLPKHFIYIDLESVTQGSLHKLKKISLAEAPSRAQRLLEADDVLFQLVRPYQQNNLHFRESELQCVASTGYAQLRASVDPVFLYQLVQTEPFLESVLTRCTGSSYPAISSNDLGLIPVLKPPTDAEQRKIAACLGSLDDWIAAEARALAALRRHKTGLMQQLFPRPGETHPRLRFPEFQNAGEWGQAKLGKLAEIVRGGSPRPIDKFLTRDPGGLNWLKIGDLRSGAKHVTETEDRVIPDALSKTRVIEPGDLILSNSMSFGRPYLSHTDLKN